MFYAIYVGFYQWVVTQRTAFEDEHCIKVNPLIIQKKNLYLDSMRALMVNSSEDKFIDINKEYTNTSLEYIEEEKSWLEKDVEFLNTWYLKFTAGKNILDGLEIQHKIYESDMRGSILMGDMFNDVFEDQGEKHIELLNKLEKNSIELNSLYKKLSEIQDLETKQKKNLIRNRFLYRAESKCPQENYDIPDVEKELEELFDDAESVPLPGIGA